MASNLAFKWDENLRDLPRDPNGLRRHIENLKAKLVQTKNPEEKAGLLGEIGSYLRSLNELDEAFEKLTEALQIISSHKLGVRREAQQKIRLAHVLQWQKKFERSNSLFSDVIILCRQNSEANIYLDFALQHAGKNFFDQQKYREALQMFEEALSLRKERGANTDQLESTIVAIRTTKQRLSIDSR